MCGQVMDPVQSFQERLLPFKKLITITRMEGVIFGRIEIEELGNILPLSNIPQFKMVMGTIQFLKPKLAQLMPAKLMTILALTYATLRPQDKSRP